MGADVRLELQDYCVKTNMIFLTTEEFGETDCFLFETVDRETDPNELKIQVHRDTGTVLCIILKRYRDSIPRAVHSLRENPLPWTFSWPELGIKEKPLEDVLLAVYRKYKDI